MAYCGGMFRLVATMRRGSSTALPQASAHYASIEAARLGAAELLREDRILKVMIVRNAVSGRFCRVDRPLAGGFHVPGS